jgi:hypothetical protein
MRQSLDAATITVDNVATARKRVRASLDPVQAWMDKSVKVEDYNSCDFSSTQGCTPPTLTITWEMAGSVVALVLVLVVGAAMWTMRSRDVA